ncbi:MAG: acetate--CoA ligase family protein [bacterium]|nr:acetate--CoA ligase family protein [bacterium]
MVKNMFNIETLLNPQSIAIIGTSSNKEHISYSLMENITDYGYQGIVYPVNPKIKAIKGIKCYPKITDIPELVDLAIVILKPDIAMEVLEESAKMGIKNFIIIASGFAEAGLVNQEERIRELSDKYNLTVLGPNCVGIINTYQNLNASFAIKGIPQKGTISIISQSGGFSIGIIKHLIKMKQGISKLISVGNKAVLNESHFLDYLSSDDTTKVIALYIEDIKNFEDFENSAYKLLKLNKPIVVFKGGETKEGSLASSSHTAAITEANDYYKALFNKTGCILTEKIEDLYFIISTIEKNSRFLDERGKKVLIVSNCGGCGVINTDFAIKHNLEIPKTSQSLKEELTKILPPSAALNNPIDIVGDADHNRLEKTIKTLIKFKDEYDYLIINMGQQSTINMEEVSKTIFKLSDELKQEGILALSCMFALDTTQPEYEQLHLSEIPVFVYPEQLTLTLQKIIEYNTNKRNILSKRIDFVLEDINIEWDKIREIVRNGEKFEGFLNPLSVFDILNLLKVSFPKTQELTEITDIEFPVVLKTGSPKIIHKTENKGIYLNIKNLDELREKSQQLKQIHQKVIVQKMVTSDLELILGIRKSKKLNKTLLILGLGGIMVELLKTFQTALIPLDDFQINHMIDKLNLSKIFENFRGKKYSKTKMIETLNKLSELSVKIEEIEEIEVNPLIINEEGVFVVDCRIKCYQ